MNKLVVEESELRELDEAKRKAKLLNEGHELDDEEATGIGAVSFLLQCLYLDDCILITIIAILLQ